MTPFMDFEHTIRLVLGDKAYHIQDAALSPVPRRQWLKKSVRKMMTHVNSLDTTPRHKEMLLSELNTIQESLKRIEEPSWTLVYGFVRLSARLLGLEYMKGGQLYTPIYSRTWSQYYTALMFAGGDVGDSYYDKQNAIAWRRSVVEKLSEAGIDDFKIALVLNTTEYEVKHLRSPRKRKAPTPTVPPDAPPEEQADEEE